MYLGGTFGSPERACKPCRVLRACKAAEPGPYPLTGLAVRAKKAYQMKRSICRRLALAGLLFFASAAQAEHYTVPLLVPAGTSSEPQGVVRILNGTDESGMVEIYAIDDAGTRSGPATFTLNASAAVQFTATDLQSGNATLGLTGGIGTSVGDARLVIETDLHIVPLAYVRAADGTLSAMHDTVRATSVSAAGQYRYDVPIFNLSTDVTQVSRLRLINPGDAEASVTIAGRDDSGSAATGGDVTLTLAAGGAQTLTAQQLEVGVTGLTGRLGAGTGKWRLTVSTDQPLQVVNIVAASAGYWNNLSTTAAPGEAPTDLESLNERFVGNAVVYVTGSDRYTLIAQAGERFTETAEIDGVSSTYMGSYGYSAIGADAGRLTLTYDDGDVCAANLYFSTHTAGWFASHCTGSDYPADGTWSGGNWSIEDDDTSPVDPVGPGDGGETSYGVGDEISDLPAGAWFPDRTSGGSVAISGGNTVVRLNNGGFVEVGDSLYTCQSAGGCEINNRQVVSGTIVRTSAASMPVDTQPRFASGSGPGDRTYTVGTAIAALTLPEASGGNGTLAYSLTSSVPGLSFDAASRRLTGKPSTAGTYAMTYSAADEDGDTATLSFTITVNPDSTGTATGGDCTVGLIVRIGESCTYPGTADGFTVNERGRGSFLTFLAGIRIRIDNQTINGRLYDFEASHQGDGVWRINRIAGSTEAPTGDDTDGDGVSDIDDPCPLDQDDNCEPSLGQRLQDEDFDLDPDGQYRGATYANGRLWIVNYGVGGWQIDAYHTTGEPDEFSGFSLDADNGDAFGIAYAYEKFYAVDHGDGKVYAYHASGSRDAASDFDLDSDVAEPYGIAFANDRFYVLDVGRDKIWVHGISGQRDADSDFDMFSEDVDESTVNPTGAIAYSNGRLHIASHHGKVYAYHTSGRRVPALDFDLDPDNGFAWGIAYADASFHVVDSADLKVYVYGGAAQANGGDDDSETRYEVGDTIAALPTGAWFPDVSRGGVAFRITGGVPAIDFGNGGYIEEGSNRYTCASAGGCQVRGREVRAGTIVETPSGVAPEDIPPTSGTAGTCEVALRRSTGAGGTETVSVALSDALVTNVGTLDTPFVVRARMDSASDFDVYKIVLSEAGLLVVLSSGALDTQAVFLQSDCTEVGRVVEDVGVVEGFAANNYNFTLGGDLYPGTYYMVVFEWASRTGNYALELGFASDDGVNGTPVIEPVAHQEVAPGGTATVDVEVTDDTGDSHAIVATSDNEDVATVDLRGGGRTRSLVITTQAAGTATVTLRAVDQEDAVATPVTFDVVVRSPTLSAPTLEPGSNDGEIEVTVVTMFRPRETRAHDYQIRAKRPQTPWHTVGCHATTNNSDGTAAGPFLVTLGNNPAGLTYEVRYRYRNSSSCNAGSPGAWSAVGEGISGGTAANATPAFPEGASTERSVYENVGGGINVGSPVAALDPDGGRDVLTYSLGGADAGSFQIVPATGQIRTRDGITYDHEARDTYSVTVEARDVHSETDRISVDIHIVDLGSVCVSPPRLRLNAGDGGLTVRWSPLADQAGSASVLGYEVERRDGTGGAWGDRQIIGGRASSNTTYTGLVNGRQYDVRIRPFGNEDACDWSTPVSGIPTTDTAPQDQSDFEDRVPPGTQLRDWRFPVPDRFSEMRDGRQLDGSYRYVRTDANRGTITFEYDEIGRAGCEISLLFSSLTSGSFLDECEGAGVNVDVNFDIEEPPAPSEQLAPRSMEEFDALALGKDMLLPGFHFGISNINISGLVSHERSDSIPGIGIQGNYFYENTGPTSGLLTIRFGCLSFRPGANPCPREEWGDTHVDNEEWIFELTFLSPDAAGYTATVHRHGRAPLTLNGFIDFKSGDNLSSFPPELLPPGSPPQASGNDLFGVDAATGFTSLSIGGDSLQTILVQDGGIQDIAYQPGDWLEPKDGGNQRMMIVGAGQTGAPVAAGLVFRAGIPAQARTVSLASGQAGLIALSVVCMQIEKGIPARGSRFFSQPKSPVGTVQMCQRNCVVAGGDAIQRCVWQCEVDAAGATSVVDDFGDSAMRQLLDALGGSSASEPIGTGVRSRSNDLKTALPRID